MLQMYGQASETGTPGTYETALRAELEHTYLEGQKAEQRISTRRGLWIAVINYWLFAATDILFIPDVAFRTILARVAVGALALLILEWQFHSGKSLKRLHLTSAIAVVGAFAAWLYFALPTKDTESLSYFMIFGAIFMMGANLFFAFSFRLSAMASGAVLVIFLLSLTLFWPSEVYALAFGTFYLSCFVFTSYLNWKLNNERYHVFQNAVEARARQQEALERGEALLRMSNTDYLTGLENRRAIDERLRDYWRQWQTSGRGFSAILVDIDFFKKYNDGYGHQEGDRCLIQIGGKIREAIEPFGGAIGRYGGEEFIVLAQISEPKSVGDLAEVIRSTIEDLRILHGERRDGTPIVTVSVGAAYTREYSGAKLEKIVQEADRALYAAKANGRNCTCVFDPTDNHVSDQNENIAALLKIAIEKNLLNMVYQPILDMKTDRINTAESLMRLRDIDGNSISPSQFIPIAERTGSIIELGRWAIRTACLEAVAGKNFEVVSVNVSPVQLRTPGFSASVAAILTETGIPGHRLAFEITEGVEMEMHPDVLNCVSDLKMLGIKLWLDDFGTGFAGLSWLRLIDFDTVKIDKTFLHGSATPRGRAMLKDIIGLIRNRGPKILVEGVETPEQMTLMRNLGIDQAQGYHIGRPLPAHMAKPELPKARSRKA